MSREMANIQSACTMSKFTDFLLRWSFRDSAIGWLSPQQQEWKSSFISVPIISTQIRLLLKYLPFHICSRLEIVSSLAKVHPCASKPQPLFQPPSQYLTRDSRCPTRKGSCQLEHFTSLIIPSIIHAIYQSKTDVPRSRSRRYFLQIVGHCLYGNDLLHEDDLTVLGSSVWPALLT